MPTTIWVQDKTRLTATLTQVLRLAAAARSAGVCVACSESSSGVEKFMVLAIAEMRGQLSHAV